MRLTASVTTRPGAIGAGPLVINMGSSILTSAPPIASIALRSCSVFSANFEESWSKARCITASASSDAVLAEYGSLPTAERNLLRLTLLDPAARAADLDWEEVARIVVGVFSSETARAGVAEMVRPLVDDLCARSALRRTEVFLLRD